MFCCDCRVGVWGSQPQASPRHRGRECGGSGGPLCPEAAWFCVCSYKERYNPPLGMESNFYSLFLLYLFTFNLKVFFFLMRLTCSCVFLIDDFIAVQSQLSEVAVVGMCISSGAQKQRSLQGASQLGAVVAAAQGRQARQSRGSPAGGGRRLEQA